MHECSRYDEIFLENCLIALEVFEAFIRESIWVLKCSNPTAYSATPKNLVESWFASRLTQ